MDKKLSNVLMLSLKEISLRRVAVILWNQHDILASIDSFDAEDAVKDNISKLDLPPLLMEKIKYLVEPVGSDLHNWKWFHETYLSTTSERFNVHILEYLCWTVLGTVDYRKTAEKLIRCKMLDIVKSYKLACLYCLDDCIPVLWENLTEESKRYFYEEEGPFHFTIPELEFCWAYIIKGEEFILDYIFGTAFGNLTTFNQNAFEYSAYIGNKCATEYFFRKLTYDEREASLFRTAQAVVTHRLKRGFISGTFPLEKLSDTLCYLLSLMSHEQQMAIFKEYPFNVLVCLLDWPWQDLFLDIAELIWTFLTEFNFVSLLNIISERIKLGYYLTKLFQEFFVRSPSEFRKYFVDDECMTGSILRNIFDVEDSEIIKVIFKNVDSVDKKRLVCSGNVFKLFYGSTLRGKWHLVEQCLQEAKLSKDDKDGLKADFLGFLTEIDTGNINRRENVWKQFLHFLDENKAKDTCKRISDEQDLSKEKNCMEERDRFTKEPHCSK
ncbi:hypothetical protein AVEN_115943-1 [Araneus ventricosus]|uniref:Uncharacterized protein n=1 Tax=Araneus ventricosus TaxID=182803 RepID=A0A4Y2M8M4_ARAVE|nr:hypothetical protein AVEN_115943-1 [Araneus ventricosus]